MSPPREVRVRVPASSANLGPGFDAFGLALARYDMVEVSTAADGLVVEVAGEGGGGAGGVPRDERHLVVRALRAGFDRFGVAPAGLRLRCTNSIPQARGLGSSAAAAVAGAVAAAVLAGRDPLSERDVLLQLTAGMEGHADNAAASLLGGFVIAWSGSEDNEGNGGGDRGGNIDGGFHAVRLDVHPGIRPVALIASVESSTSATRGLLPKQVPLADAAFTGGRTALCVHAMTARPDLLMAATLDRLHQPYRRSAYPASATLVDTLRGQGIPAAISGAGPSVLAFPPQGRLPEGLAGRVIAGGFAVCPLEVDQVGATVESG